MLYLQWSLLLAYTVERRLQLYADLMFRPELSMGWVNPRVGLGWVVVPKRQKPKKLKNTFAKFIDTDGHGVSWVGLGPGSKFPLWYGLGCLGSVN